MKRVSEKRGSIVTLNVSILSMVQSPSKLREDLSCRQSISQDSIQ